MDEFRKLKRKQLDAEYANTSTGSTRRERVEAECQRRDRRFKRMIAALGLGVGVLAALAAWLR
jgi:hypothetical protein